MTEQTGEGFIRALVNAWDCCGMCAGGVLAKRDRALARDFKEAVIDGMTPPEGDPDDAFWRGAQWAYGQVRDRLDNMPEETA